MTVAEAATDTSAARAGNYRIDVCGTRGVRTRAGVPDTPGRWPGSDNPLRKRPANFFVADTWDGAKDAALDEYRTLRDRIDAIIADIEALPHPDDT